LDWYKKKKNQIETYLENLFLADRNDILFLTPKGYVVCDEIIANLIS